MTQKEFIDKVKSEEGIFSQNDLEEFLSGKFKLKPLATEIEPDKHRWYETTVSIWRCDDGVIGVRLPNQLYSEGMSWDDCGEEPEFFSVREKTVVTYKTIEKIV